MTLEDVNPIKALHDVGQNIWLDNITRDLLDRHTLEDYIDRLSVMGLTSNPSIFDHAIKGNAAYDDAIRVKASRFDSGEGRWTIKAAIEQAAGGR